LPFIALLAVTAIIIAGCQEATRSPFSGKEVTADQLVAEATAQERLATKKADDARRVAEEKMRAAKRDAEMRALSIVAEADGATTSAKTELAKLRISTEATVAAAIQSARAADDDFAAEMANIETITQGGLEAIEAKRQSKLGVLSFVANNPFVRTAASSVGVDSSGIGGILFPVAAAAVSLWVGRRSGDTKARVATARADQAEADKRIAQATTDEQWDEALQVGKDIGDEKIASYNKAVDRVSETTKADAIQKQMDALTALVTALTPKPAAPATPVPA